MPWGRVRSCPARRAVRTLWPPVSLQKDQTAALYSTPPRRPTPIGRQYPNRVIPPRHLLARGSNPTANPSHPVLTRSALGTVQLAPSRVPWNGIRAFPGRKPARNGSRGAKFGGNRGGGLSVAVSEQGRSDSGDPEIRPKNPPHGASEPSKPVGNHNKPATDRPSPPELSANRCGIPHPGGKFT